MTAQGSKGAAVLGAEGAVEEKVDGRTDRAQQMRDCV